MMRRLVVDNMQVDYGSKRYGFIKIPPHLLRPRPVNPVYCGGVRWLEVFTSHHIGI